MSRIDETTTISAHARSGFGAFPAATSAPDHEVVALLRGEIRALQDRLTLYVTAADHMAHGLSMFDGARRLLLSNRRYRELWSLPEPLVRPGASFVATMQAVQAVERKIEARQDGTPDPTLPPSVTRREWLLGDGRCIAVTAVELPGGENVALHEDVTERYLAQRRIEHLTHHDSLTGAANLAQLRAETERALIRARRGEAFALLALDIDRFRLVNDSVGLAAGDDLLQRIAERLGRCLRAGDLLARPSGDVFVVLQHATEPSGATALAYRLLQALEKPFDVNGRTVHLSASTGIAIAPQDGASVDEVLTNANLALARAKAEGGGQLRYFEATMDLRMRELHRVECDLRGALGGDQFELAFQPQVIADDGQVVGVEALIRWNHPTRGRVSPADFIPVAESTGLIVPIGRWVLRQACAAAVLWPETVRLSVNVSPVQIRHPSLFDDVVQALAETGLPARRLELEITEAVLLRDSDQALSILHRLRDQGICVALDDFGTGYSSLSYLRRFPFDRIKIDRSFVAHVESSPDAMAIIQAVSSLSERLGMLTTVEGVETLEQLDAVRRLGCREIQGYLYSRPRPAAEIGGLIDRGPLLPDPRP